MCTDVKLDMDKTSCNCLDAQCKHPKEALEYCSCCDVVMCKACGQKWNNSYQFTYYPPLFQPAPYVPMTPYDPDPPFYYTTCNCGD